MTTLAATIDATTELLVITGSTVGAARGETYRIDDELVVLQSFGLLAIDNATYTDLTKWNVRRAQHGTSGAQHLAGATVVRATPAYLSGLSLAPPEPFPTPLGVDVRDYGAKGDGITDDAAAIQAAIEAASAAGGGTVTFPAGTFLLGSSLVLRRAVSIRGAGSGVTNDHAASWDIGFVVTAGTILTYPGGTVFTQDMSAGLGTLPAIDGIIIERLGFNDVGSIIACGATNKSGLCGSVIRDVFASNVSGYAIDLTNTMHVEVMNVRASYAYGLVRITGDYDTAVVNNGPGNSLLRDLFCHVSLAGHPYPTILLRTLDPNGNGTTMGGIRFQNVQINRWLSTDLTGTGVTVEGATLDTSIVTTQFDDLSVEGFCAHRLSLHNAQNTRVVWSSGAIVGQATDEFCLRSAKLTDIHSMDVSAILDMDTDSFPSYYNGQMHAFVGSVMPIGLWHDGALNATRFSTGDPYAKSLINNGVGEWLMPYAQINFNNAIGGGIKHHYANWPADTLNMDPTFMGIVNLDYNGAMAVLLPTAVGYQGGVLTLKRTGATGTATLTGASSQTIDGSTTNTWLDAQYKFLSLQSDGANWLIVSKG